MQLSLRPAMARSDGEGGVIFLECDMSKLAIPHELSFSSATAARRFFCATKVTKSFPIW